MNSISLTNLLKPNTLNDIVGHKELLSSDGILRKMIEKNFLVSLLFYGPPGVGKTSMEIALAKDLKMDFIIFNCANDTKEKLVSLTGNRGLFAPKIVILEEIHRMHKNVQDVLLKGLETHEFYIFASTTENPFFTVNPAIRSRMTILQLQPLNSNEINEWIIKLLNNQLKGKLSFNNDAIAMLSELSNGDMRTVINALELLINLYDDYEITKSIIKKIIPNAHLINDIDGDEYHNLKSAFQKSIRGSDVNAALHYLSRLLAGGDYESLLRRLLILAYEDIGMANPNLCARTKIACDAFRELGMPEGILPLGSIVIELALSAKSDSASRAVFKAYADIVGKNKSYPIPQYLWDTHYKIAIKLGAGINYLNPHDFKNDWINQTYLPKLLKDKIYYIPKMHNEYERKLYEIYQSFTKK